jgi:hypothetical protein
MPHQTLQGFVSCRLVSAKSIGNATCFSSLLAVAVSVQHDKRISLLNNIFSLAVNEYLFKALNRNN